MKLGIFDSGLGGLTILRSLRRRLPQADIVYFADQAHAPYGERSPEDLYDILKHNLQVLEDAEVDAVVMGCNTTCAVASVYGMPKTRVPVFNLIEAGANAAFAACSFAVGIVATTATVTTKAYTRSIQRRQEVIQVEEIAAPELAPFVESGGTEADELVAAVCSRFQVRPTLLVLGCSHYPYLAASFKRALPGVPILDPALAQADEVAAYARQCNKEHAGSGTLRAWTNGDTALFEKYIAEFQATSPGIVRAAESLAY